MLVATRLYIFCLYTFAVALFTSTALLSFYQVLIFVLTLYFALRLKWEGDFRWLASQKLLLLYVAVAIVSLIVNHKSALDESGNFGRYFAYALLAYGFVYFFREANHKKHIRILLTILIVTTSLAHISGAIGYFTGFNPLRFRKASDFTRSTGMYGLGITYGNSTQFLFLVYLGLLTQYKHIADFISKKLLIVATILTAAGLILSLTRGAILGVLIATPFLFIKSSPKLFKASMLVVGLLLVSAVTLSVVLPSSNRLSYKSDSNKIRISQYETAWVAFKEKPFLGQGFCQFSSQVKRLKEAYDIGFKKFLGAAHDNYLEALASTGAIGFIVFLGFVLMWGLELIYIDHFLKPTLISVWVAFVVSGLFQNTFTDNENIFLVLFLYSIGVFLRIRPKANHI